MRIALATSSYAPHVGGVEEHVRNVARVLSERGHDVVVWTVEREGGFDIATVDGIKVWSLPAPLPARSVPSLARFAVRSPGAAYRWRQAFRAHRPDVVHVHCFGPNGTYARVLSGRYRTPMIVSSHGETVADDAGVFTHSRFAVHSLRRALADAAVVTGCSQVALDDLVERFGLPLGTGTVVHNGIDPEETAGPPPAGVDGRYIAAVGRLQLVKGFDLLLDAFARAELPNEVRLVIGGGGPQLEPLRAQAVRLGVDDRVMFPGWLDRPTVAGLLRGAVVGVVPSRFEAFGIAVLEIWRAVTPVIATSLGGPPEFVREGTDGLLVDPKDIDALAAALARLLADDSLRQALARAGAAHVRDFTWGQTADAYEAIYGTVRAHRTEPR